MAQVEFDQALAEQLEKLYSTRDVLRRRRLVYEALGAQRGERILDVGSGPGFYVAELLEQVGDSGSIVGVDSSAAMLGVAARRCEGHENVDFHEADATSLPVDDASFDAALSVQVLEYVKDVPAALRELRRILKPGGRLLVWDVDWSTASMHSSDPARMGRVLEAWDAHLSHPALPRTLTKHLRDAGFDNISCEGHAFATNEFTPDAYGSALVPLLQRYVAEQGAIPRGELDEWGREQLELGERGEFYFAVVQVCFTAAARAR